MKINHKGFTLIELLVVIAIVGILSSVVLANLNGTRAKARDVKRIADLKSLQLALELYFDNYRIYPSVLDSLKPTFISVIPNSPDGTAYTYKPLVVGGGTCNNYHLGAVLEQSTNAELTTDVDAVAGTIAGAGCGDASGGAGATVTGSDFSGASTDCVSGSGTDKCYDLTP